MICIPTTLLIIIIAPIIVGAIYSLNKKQEGLNDSKAD